MPYLDFKKEKSFGDLIVEVDVTFPDNLDTNMIPLLRDILEVERDISQ
jgi:DnaJ-class molecular chaperone